MKRKHIFYVTLLHIRLDPILNDILYEHRDLAVTQDLILAHAWQQEIGDAAIVELLHAVCGGHLFQLGSIGQTQQGVHAS